MQYAYSPAGLAQEDAAKVAGILQSRLDALVDLQLTLKHAHWNVIGSDFMSVHEMFDTNVKAVRSMADDVAERIATFGGIPNGLPGSLVMRRDWDDYSLGRGVAAAHLGALDRVYDRVIGGHRLSIAEIEPIDVVTADMLTTQTAALEKEQWFIRAHLQNTTGELPTTDSADQLDAAAAAATADHLA